MYAFFTRSSAANVPVNMELCKHLGIRKDTYSVSIPLGATINMAGAAITITVMAMAAAHTMGIAINPVTAGILSFWLQLAPAVLPVLPAAPCFLLRCAAPCSASATISPCKLWELAS